MGEAFSKFWKVLSIMWIRQHPQMQCRLNAMIAFVAEWQQRACTYSFIGKALLLATFCKARGRICRHSFDCIVCVIAL